jgi:hypothetical protein
VDWKSPNLPAVSSPSTGRLHHAVSGDDRPRRLSRFQQLVISAVAVMGRERLTDLSVDACDELAIFQARPPTPGLARSERQRLAIFETASQCLAREPETGAGRPAIAQTASRLQRPSLTELPICVPNRQSHRLVDSLTRCCAK